MKKIGFLILLIVLVFIFFGVKSLYACDLSIISEKNEVFVGEEIKVTLERVKTHRTCVLPIEETKIEIINGEIISESEWIESTKDTKEIVVKFNEPGTGIIKVIRDCSKGGLMVWTKEFNVLSLPPQTSDSQPSNQTTSESPDITTDTQTPTTTNSTTPTTTQNPSTSPTIPTSQPSNQTMPENPDTPNTQTPTTTNLTNHQDQIENELNKQDTIYLFNPQTLLYIILIILSLIFVSLKLYKLRFFTLLFSLAILGFYFGGCLCPISYIGKLFSVQFLSIAFYIFLGLVIFISIITLFKGRVFCGWVCPHGALQEFIYKVKAKKIEKIENYLKYIKYFVFASVVVLSFIYSKNYFCEVYPFKVLYNISGTGFILIFAIIIFFISIFIYRPFCRFICPFGAYLGLISKLGEKLGLNKNKITESCIKCKKCLKECNSKAVSEENDCYKIDYKDCFICGDCYDNCPKNK